jgi:hypothetical protein
MPKDTDQHTDCDCPECQEWREEAVWGIYLTGVSRDTEEEHGKETEEIQSGDLPVFGE